MLSHKTGRYTRRSSFGFVLTAAAVWGGIALGFHGILAASLGLSFGLTVELGYLYLAYRRGQAALRSHWQSSVAPSMGG